MRYLVGSRLLTASGVTDQATPSFRWRSPSSGSLTSLAHVAIFRPAGLQALRTRGEGIRAATLYTAPRTQALRPWRVRTRTGPMTDWVSGARFLASRDAGLPPAPRLPRSRLTLAPANDQPTIPGGQPRSKRDTPDHVLRALALGTGGGDWLPRQDRWRKFWAFACVMYAVVLLLAVSWKMAASLVGLGAAMVVIGLVARRRDDAMPIISTPAVAIGLVFGTLLQVGLWLPIERITLKDGSARVGYVLNAADPIVILWREGGLVYVKQANVSDRQPCTDGSTGPGLDDLVRESTPSCPTAKVTAPGK
jgi:hypothetical protein